MKIGRRWWTSKKWSLKLKGPPPLPGVSVCCQCKGGKYSATVVDILDNKVMYVHVYIWIYVSTFVWYAMWNNLVSVVAWPHKHEEMCSSCITAYSMQQLAPETIGSHLSMLLLSYIKVVHMPVAAGNSKKKVWCSLLHIYVALIKWVCIWNIIMHRSRSRSRIKVEIYSSLTSKL